MPTLRPVFAMLAGQERTVTAMNVGWANISPPLGLKRALLVQLENFPQQAQEWAVQYVQQDRVAMYLYLPVFALSLMLFRRAGILIGHAKCWDPNLKLRVKVQVSVRFAHAHALLQTLDVRSYRRFLMLLLMRAPLAVMVFVEMA